jgi:hypothetical protein
MRPWDGHCPECGCDTIELLYVRPEFLSKECSDCGHTWHEPKEPEPKPTPGYVQRTAAEMLEAQDCATVPAPALTVAEQFRTEPLRTICRETDQ